MIQSDCADNCPTTCNTWESFESEHDPWTVDPTLSVTCEGKSFEYLIYLQSIELQR